MFCYFSTLHCFLYEDIIYCVLKSAIPLLLLNHDMTGRKYRSTDIMFFYDQYAGVHQSYTLFRHREISRPIAFHTSIEHCPLNRVTAVRVPDNMK